MDLQIGIFCLVIASLSSLVIYIILSFSSIKEDSFEEAKASRRKIFKQYQDQSKTGVEKAKDKKPKKSSKKAKKNDADEETPLPKENEGEVGDDKEVKKDEVTPKLVDDPKAQIKEPELKKGNKADKTKKLPGTSSSAPNLPSASQNKPPIRVTSEKQLTSKASKKKMDETHGKAREDDIAEPSNPSRPVNEDLGKELVAQQPETVVKHAPKPSKKKRSEISSLHQLSHEKEAVNINLLVSLVQKAELSRTEIQLLIDALLNKQQEDISEWLKGRQDPQVKLQKQLTELEEALKDEKQISAGFQAKLKELRNEINADKVNARHTEELLTTVQNDCKTLSMKLQQTIEENQVLGAKIQQYQKQLADEQMTVRQLKDEQGIQQQITEKQCHEAVISLQAQVSQYAAQSQELQAANNTLRNEIAMLQENDLRIQEEYREVNANLERALSAATFDVNATRNELSNVERALADTRAENDSNTGLINTLKIENQRLQEQNKQFLEQCSDLSKENETLKEKISETLENGFSNPNKQEMADVEERLAETENAMTVLRSELDLKNTKIEELTSLVNSTNHECQKAKSSLEKATIEISSLKLEVSDLPNKDQEDTITQLKNILNDKSREVTDLKGELETCKLRNNELRNKNWKVVEALTKAEQSLQSKILNEQKTNESSGCYSEMKVRSLIKKMMNQIHPDVTIIEAKDSIEDWLEKVEEALDHYNVSPSSTSDLESQNSQLQSLVQHYKTIINETEGMLNQLQNHVEVEESKWKEKLHTLEEELDLLKQQTANKYMDVLRRHPYSI